MQNTDIIYCEYIVSILYLVPSILILDFSRFLNEEVTKFKQRNLNGQTKGRRYGAALNN